MSGPLIGMAVLIGPTLWLGWRSYVTEPRRTAARQAAMDRHPAGKGGSGG